MSRTPTVQEVFDRFLTELQVGRSPETVRTYATVLTCFGDYLRQVPLDPAKCSLTSLRAEHFLDFPVWLTGERWRGKPRTSAVATYLSALQSWMRYLMREKVHPDLAAESERIREAYRGIKGRGARKLPRILQPHELEKLAEAVRMRPRTKHVRLIVARLRDVALIESFRSTGARISELLGGNLEDLQVRQRALRIVGKGSRERLIFFDQRAWEALKNYLDARTSLRLAQKGKTTPLFARHSRSAGKSLLRLTPDGARMNLRRYVKLAGLQSRITPHLFRHLFATTVLEKTGDLAATQDLLGHASPATTRIYAKLVVSRLRKIHEQVFAG